MISIRKATLADELVLLEWVNQYDSLSTKIETKNKILLSKHKKWFLERLNDLGTYIWIILNEKRKPLGQIRFQKKIEKYFDVDIYVESNERRKGIAKKALYLAQRETGLKPLRAFVKKNNINSYNFFLSNGFLLQLEDESMWVLIKN